MSRDVDPRLNFIDTTVERNLLFLEKDKYLLIIDRTDLKGFKAYKARR